jgi:hypothetical protein
VVGEAEPVPATRDDDDDDGAKAWETVLDTPRDALLVPGRDMGLDGIVGVETDGVLTGGTGTEGVVIDGTGRDGTVGTWTAGVVSAGTGGAAVGTLIDGTVSARLACGRVPKIGRSATAARAMPRINRDPRLSHPPVVGPRRVAPRLPFIAGDIYPFLIKPNRRSCEKVRRVYLVELAARPTGSPPTQILPVQRAANASPGANVSVDDPGTASRLRGPAALRSGA